jgi:protocatechuate 3,4-dioxygenase beta subunit
MSDDHDELTRRHMFGWMARIALTPVIGGCSSDTSSVAADAAQAGSCARVPAETAGPYPGDGTNGPNALTLSGINRSDIRTSVGTATGTAAGVDLKITLTIVNATTCEPLAGYSLYIWHCDRAGDYSMYTGNAQAENYLRGVQVTDANGEVTFTTIFPGCYAGRWPHFHVEIYKDAQKVVSQLALPKATCDVVYATPGYEQSAINLAEVILDEDTAFGDGSTLQMMSVTGGVGANLASTLSLAIS